MRGIVVPERGEDFTADPVELFFDLAFVFAFSQLVGHLVHHPTWTGVGEAALVMALLWLPWSQLTWAANAVSGNGRAVRLMFLLGTVASVPMAAATSTAFGAGGSVFVASLSVIFLIGAAMALLGVRDEPEVFRSTLLWNLTSLAALVALWVGGALEGEARVVAWLVATLIVLAAMVGAGSGEWIIRPRHFAERHGLIMIIALGEVVVAIGVPVVAALEEGAGLPGATVGALASAGAFAGLVWWSYFDRFSPGLEHRATQLPATDAGRYVRDVYTWGHLPIVSGVILAAAALEEIALHPTDPVDASFRLMLAGGVALTMLGVVLTVRRAYAALAVERLVGVLAIAALIAAAGSWTGLSLLVAVDAAVLVMLVVEHRRVESARPAASVAQPS